MLTHVYIDSAAKRNKSENFDTGHTTQDIERLHPKDRDRSSSDAM